TAPEIVRDLRLTCRILKKHVDDIVWLKLSCPLVEEVRVTVVPKETEHNLSSTLQLAYQVSRKNKNIFEMRLKSIAGITKQLERHKWEYHVMYEFSFETLQKHEENHIKKCIGKRVGTISITFCGYPSWIVDRILDGLTAQRLKAEIDPIRDSHINVLLDPYATQIKELFLIVNTIDLSHPGR
ncbi:hypothetical protein PMAYCL1PPCAC_20668, partial [Pristionchus mayeri]